MRIFKSFFNTNSDKGETLVKHEEKARTQEQKLMDAFTATGRTHGLSPSMLATHPDFNMVPITSIRRGICNLKKRGFIVETGELVKGLYGRNERIYKKA